MRVSVPLGQALDGSEIRTFGRWVVDASVVKLHKCFGKGAWVSAGVLGKDGKEFCGLS